jgi:hypothetical protein
MTVVQNKGTFVNCLTTYPVTHVSVITDTRKTAHTVRTGCLCVAVVKHCQTTIVRSGALVGIHTSNLILNVIARHACTVKAKPVVGADGR